jgi:hypothetical protein
VDRAVTRRVDAVRRLFFAEVALDEKLQTSEKARIHADFRKLAEMRVLVI